MTKITFLLSIFIYMTYNSVLSLKINVPYYRDPRIHGFGNFGLGGRIHAEIAPKITKFIDEFAYDGIEVRNECFKNYVYENSVLDLCCGTGFSTPPVSLNPLNRGIDISKYMVNKARRIHENKQFYIGNAEKYYPENGTMFDVTTCYFSFHEMPKDAMLSIIENAKHITKNKIIIVDISPEYVPGKNMIIGEPYLHEYLNRIRDTLDDFNEEIIIPKRVHMWTYNISPKSETTIII